MNIRPIRTEEDLTWALAEVEPYFVNEPEKGSEDAARFEILADLIRAYEALHWAIDERAPYGRSDQRGAAVRVAKKDHIAKILRRKNGVMSASSGRFVRSPGMPIRRMRRALKAG